MAMRHPWCVSIALGAAAGLAAAVSPGGLVLGACSILLVVGLTRGDRTARRLALSALGLRWMLIAGITAALVATGRTYPAGGETALAILGDEGYYSIRSHWLLNRITGAPLAPDDWEAVAQEFHDNRYGKSGHLYPMAFFYHLFGYSPSAAKGLSALALVLAGLLIYDMARRMGGPRAALIAGTLTWAWPSMCLWSVTNLKDAHAVFVLCLALWTFQRWLAGPRQAHWLFVALLSLGAYATIKEYLWAIVAAAMGVAGVCHVRPAWLRRALGAATVFALAVTVILQADAWDQRARAAIRMVAMRHIHHALQQSDASRSYRLLPDHYYVPPITDAGLRALGYGDAVVMAVRGTGQFLVRPWPWDAASAMQRAAMPQMLVWYALVVLAGLGIWRCLRASWRATLLPLAVLAGVTLSLAITSGNVGTTLRHRDLIAPLYFLFAAAAVAGVPRGQPHRFSEAAGP